MVKLNYFNLLSWLDGTTCYCPSCTKDRFSFFTPEETTEVVETVESVTSITDFQTAFSEVFSLVLDNKLFVICFLSCVGFAIISSIFSLVRRVINGE